MHQNCCRYDQQCCHLKFGSWSHNTKQLDILIHQQLDSWLGRIDLDFFEDTNSEWQVIDTMAEKNQSTFFYGNRVETFSTITFTVCIRRRSFFYTINLVMPSSALMILALCCFCLPADCGEKVSLSVSILLNVLFFLNFYLNIAPQTSHVVPLIGRYIFSTVVIIFFSTATCVYCQHSIYIFQRITDEDMKEKLEQEKQQQQQKQQNNQSSNLGKMARDLKKCVDEQLDLFLEANRDLKQRVKEILSKYKPKVPKCCRREKKRLVIETLVHRIRKVSLSNPEIFTDQLEELLSWSRRYRILATAYIFRGANDDIQTIANSLYIRNANREARDDLRIKVGRSSMIFLAIFLLVAFLSRFANIESF